VANVARLNLDRNQAQLSTDVNRLSSGLRINAAADDPSGLAISQSLRAHVGAYDASSGNVQDANNALTVADGAMATCDDLLQRMRSLAVEASSDFTSAQDRADLQAEVSQLLQEVNRIAQDTTFNGRALFQQIAPSYTTPIVETAGTTSQVGPATSITLTVPAGTAPGTVLFAGIAAIGYANVVTPPAGWTLVGTQTTYSTQIDVYEHTVAAGDPATATWTDTRSDYISGQIVALSGVTANPVEQVAGYANAGGGGGVAGAAPPGATVNGTAALAFFTQDTSGGAGTAGAGFTEVGSTYATQPYHPIETQVETGVSDGAQPVASYSGNTNNNDGILLLLAPLVTDGSAQPLDVHDGAAEGDITGITIPGISTSQLGISAIDLTTTSATSDIAGAQAAEALLDAALQTLNAARAQVGGQIVRLNDDASDDQTAALNEQAAESSIADANIGQTTTDYTRLSVLVQIGTSVLAQSNAAPQAVLQLFG
jgi:flagellin